MKATKKIAAMILSVIMAVLMVIPVVAAENYTISVPENAQTEGHTYEIYQIFTGDYSESEEKGSVLSNVKWGKNGIETEGTEVSETVLNDLANASGSEKDLLEVITEYANLETDEYSTVAAGESENVPAGYYLIKDVDKSLEGKDDAYTLYIVQVVGNVTIEPKADVPEFEKKVQDTNDSTGETSGWQDSADWDIGDDVPFKLEGTVGSDYDNYETYKFIFHDSLSKGLSFNGNVTVKVDGVEITEGYTLVPVGSTTDDCTFEVRFDNLKEIDSVHAGSVITVEYTAKLNTEAVIGSAGNPNTAHLEFSNNPNAGQDGTGETPDDTVIVFTYKTVINKVDDNNQPLTGAEFTLEKKVGNGWETIDVVKNAEGTTFTFTGLDDGTYRLTETKTPAGYNSIDPIEFTITAQHTIESDDPRLEGLNGNTVSGEINLSPAEEDEDALTANVVNKKGATLPETGGMGTTIFYVIGGILVIGAGVLLIAKKRMNNSEVR